MTDKQEFDNFFKNRQGLLTQIKKALQYLNKPFTETSFYRTTLVSFLMGFKYPNLTNIYSVDYQNIFKAIRAGANYSDLLKFRTDKLNEQVSNENQIAVNNIAYEDWLANYENPIDTILKYAGWLGAGLFLMFILKNANE